MGGVHGRGMAEVEQRHTRYPTQDVKRRATEHRGIASLNTTFEFENVNLKPGTFF